MSGTVLSCHNLDFLKVSCGMGGKVATVIFLLILVAVVTSCRSTKEIQIVKDTVVMSDTMEIYVHDTTKITETKYDSIDRTVERIVYVDSNGVWHEKEVQTLIHYNNMQSEKFKVLEYEYQRKIKDLEKELKEKEFESTVYVDKPLRWWQKSLMYLGAAFLLVLLLSGIMKLKKIKLK